KKAGLRAGFPVDGGAPPPFRLGAAPARADIPPPLTSLPGSPEAAAKFFMSISTLPRVRAAYDDLVARGALAADPAQVEAAGELDRVLDALVAARPKRLFGFFEKPAFVRGLYLHGAVGRGKTMLMDLFFAAVPFA